MLEAHTILLVKFIFQSLLRRHGLLCFIIFILIVQVREKQLNGENTPSCCPQNSFAPTSITEGENKMKAKDILPSKVKKTRYQFAYLTYCKGPECHTIYKSKNHNNHTNECVKVLHKCPCRTKFSFKLS